MFIAAVSLDFDLLREKRPGIFVHEDDMRNEYIEKHDRPEQMRSHPDRKVDIYTCLCLDGRFDVSSRRVMLNAVSNPGRSDRWSDVCAVLCRMGGNAAIRSVHHLQHRQ